MEPPPTAARASPFRAQALGPHRRPHGEVATGGHWRPEDEGDGSGRPGTGDVRLGRLSLLVVRGAGTGMGSRYPLDFGARPLYNISNVDCWFVGQHLVDSQEFVGSRVKRIIKPFVWRFKHAVKAPCFPI